MEHTTQIPSEIDLLARAFAYTVFSHDMAYAYLDAEQKIRYASPNFAAFVSKPMPQLKGMLLTEAIWEFIGAETSLQAIQNGQQPFYKLERVQRTLPNNRTQYLSFQVMPYDVQNHNLGLLLLVENVTDNCLLEQTLTQERNELRLTRQLLLETNKQLDQLNHHKSLMLSMAAHDFRNPIGIIQAHAALLANGPATKDEISLHLSPVNRQIHYLRLLIDNILNLDQAETGVLSVKPKPCNLKDLLAEVTEDIAILADVDQMSIQLTLPTTSIWALVDTNHFRQILFNLLNNAIKYARNNTTIQVELTAENNLAAIAIQDSGIGMTDAQIANLFQAYYRTPDVQDSDIAGIGLGLYIVKTLVEANGGQIKVMSKHQQGTTFKLYFPLIKPPADTSPTIKGDV